MKKEHEEAVASGRVVKSNTFNTDRGSYTIDILAHNGSFYFAKSKNGKTVEFVNLTDKINDK